MKKRHKWNRSAPKRGRVVDGSVTYCVKCGCVRQFVKGIPCYWIGDNAYDKVTPNCKYTMKNTTPTPEAEELNKIEPTKETIDGQLNACNILNEEQRALYHKAVLFTKAWFVDELREKEKEIEILKKERLDYIKTPLGRKCDELESQLRDKEQEIETLKGIIEIRDADYETLNNTNTRHYKELRAKEGECERLKESIIEWRKVIGDFIKHINNEQKSLH